MKKIVSIMLVMILVMGMSLPVMASEDSGALGDGNTTALSFEVAPSYIITIPTAINDASPTGEYKVNQNTLLNAAQKIQFKISGASNYDEENSLFRLQNGSDTTVYLPYTMTKPGTTEPEVIDMNSVFLEADAAQAYTGTSIILTCNLGTAIAAGTYSDTLTITVSVVNK